MLFKESTTDKFVTLSRKNIMQKQSKTDFMKKCLFDVTFVISVASLFCFGSVYANDIRLDTGDTAGANLSSGSQISSDENGHVYVTWYDYRNGTTDIYINHSNDSGATWEGDTRLDTGDTAGANPSSGSKISSDENGHVYVTWYDNRNGSADIYFNNLSASNEVIVDFGGLYGTWVYVNNSTWAKLHDLSPEIITTGDMDGNGLDDVIIDFGVNGTWVYMNNSTWAQLHTISPEIMASGDIDGGGSADVILGFGSLGTWIRKNNSTWVQLHTLSPETMTIGDIDGSGQDDIIVDFGSLGTWVRMDDSSWAQLHTLSPEIMIIGDIDGNSKDDIIVDFGNLGVWVRMNNSSWAQLRTLSPEAMTAGDVDGSGKDDVIIDFGGSEGVDVYMNNSTWIDLDGLSPEIITTGDMDGN